MSKWSELKKRLKCNKPVPSSKPEKKRMVKACQDGQEKLVHFGDATMKIKKHIPERKKSYCSRSAGIKGALNKLSANYWSRKAWDC